MKNQALFSSKDKSKKLKCRLLQFLCGALNVNLMSLKLFLFIKMGDHVRFDMHFLGKPFSTDFTDKWFLSSMYSHVHV